MNLKHGLPSGFEACGLVVYIRTGAAWWIWASCRMPELNDLEGMGLLEQSIERIERSGKEVAPWLLTDEERKSIFDRIVWFMGGGVDDLPKRTRGKKPKERILDYEKDLDALYAAFMQSYGIDLYEDAQGKFLIDRMHWWKFLALANNLPTGSMLVDYFMHYRSMDIATLPRKTEADKKYFKQVSEIKGRVALGALPQEKAKKEPAYAARARQLAAEREKAK